MAVSGDLIMAPGPTGQPSCPSQAEIKYPRINLTREKLLNYLANKVTFGAVFRSIGQKGDCDRNTLIKDGMLNFENIKVSTYVSFEYRGNNYEGILRRVHGGGATVWHLMVNNFYYGRLTYTGK